MKKPIVFSFVREQRIFMVSLLALLSFLAVLCLGLVISLGTAVKRWNAQWNLMATVQVMPGGNVTAVQKAIDGTKNDIVSLREISTEESAAMLKPWLASSDALTGYIPKMTELQFKNASARNDFGSRVAGIDGVRFVTFAGGMRATTSVGWQIILISFFVLALVLASIILCISYITKNTTLIHRHELEILNQVGARDSFIAKQLMSIILRLAAIGTAIGFVVAAPVLLIIISMAHSLRVGMFTQMAVPGIGWIVLIVLAVGIIGLSVITTRKTVMRILRE
ncbi:MAG: hypothetical protein FWC51_00305 [Proteobacteria bacterium]|nr:hypothetical protein [Pseudomonadota bacterium]